MLIGVCLSSVAAIIFCLYPLVQWQQEGSGGWLQRSVALPGGITATLDTVGPRGSEALLFSRERMCRSVHAMCAHLMMTCIALKPG